MRKKCGSEAANTPIDINNDSTFHLAAKKKQEAFALKAGQLTCSFIISSRGIVVLLASCVLMVTDISMTRSNANNKKLRIRARSSLLRLVCGTLICAYTMYSLHLGSRSVNEKESNSSSEEFEAHQQQRLLPILRDSTTTRSTGSSSPPTLLSSRQRLDLFQANASTCIMGPQHTVDSSKPVRVRVLLFEHKKKKFRFRRSGPHQDVGDEVLNICMDGFERSPYFTLLPSVVVPDFTLEPDFVIKEDKDVVWVVDMRRTVFRHSYSIGKQLVLAAQATLRYQNSSSTSPKLKVVLMNFRDKIKERTLCTKGAQELMGLLGGPSTGNVRSVVQQVVRDRAWNPQRSFPDVGSVWDSRGDTACFGGLPTLRVPYTVRSDYASAVLSIAADTENITNNVVLPANATIKVPRTTDIAHFWATTNNTENANLRNAVTQLVLSLNNTVVAGKPPLTVVAGFVSTPNAVGRTEVSPDYLKALVTTKIIVVAQRDGWEDHYRFFEAYVGGAMVMTDPMLSLPDGLVDGESIVVYQSINHLRELLLYYLDPEHESERLGIARRGWEIAITQHRTYHWMEQIFFGRRISP